MNKDYRGDTFFRNYSIRLDNELYEFDNGDKIKVAFCQYGKEKQLLKEIELVEGKTEVEVAWDAQEMATLSIGEYILEVEFNTKKFVKTEQEKIKIDEDFIYGEQQ